MNLPIILIAALIRCSVNGFWFPAQDQTALAGKGGKIPSMVLPDFDPGCYLCPGNTRPTAAKTRNIPARMFL